MNLLNIKYGRKISALFFIVYLSFFSISIFHIHNIDLLFSDHPVLISSVSDSTDPYSDGNSNCMINHLANTILIYFYSTINLISDIRAASFFEEKDSRPYNSDFTSIPSFRAPPAVSSIIF